MRKMRKNPNLEFPIWNTDNYEPFHFRFFENVTLPCLQKAVLIYFNGCNQEPVLRAPVKNFFMSGADPRGFRPDSPVLHCTIHPTS